MPRYSRIFNDLEFDAVKDTAKHCERLITCAKFYLKNGNNIPPNIKELMENILLFYDEHKVLSDRQQNFLDKNIPNSIPVSSYNLFKRKLAEAHDLLNTANNTLPLTSEEVISASGNISITNQDINTNNISGTRYRKEPIKKIPKEPKKEKTLTEEVEKLYPEKRKLYL